MPGLEFVIIRTFDGYREVSTPHLSTRLDSVNSKVFISIPYMFYKKLAFILYALFQIFLQRADKNNIPGKYLENQLCSNFFKMAATWIKVTFLVSRIRSKVDQWGCVLQWGRGNNSIFRSGPSQGVRLKRGGHMYAFL